MSIEQRLCQSEWAGLKGLLKCGGRGDRPKQGPPQLPLIQTPQGEVLIEDVEIATQEHFAGVELGNQVDESELVTSYNSFPLLLADGIDRDARVPPSIYETERLSGKAKAGIAPGTDGFKGCLGRIAARPLARSINPILFKIAATCREPIAFKGGRLGHFWKGSGDPTKVAAMRSILVSPVISRFKCKWGGLEGRGCDLAVHTARMLWQANDKRKNFLGNAAPGSR
eukprot:9483533-Pyramimonas_sp.AAC.1